MTALRLDGVGVRAGSACLIADVTVDCPPGTFVGLIGPNGSGKSTTLKTVYRAVAPSTGTVLIDGVDLVRELTPRRSAQRVAALAQEPSADVEFTVLEVVAAGRIPHRRSWQPLTVTDHDIVTDALETVGMTAHAGRAFTALSGGEKQRVLLARALAQQPTLLVLDEPTNHLDIATQLGLLDLVRSLRVTVLAALHDLNLAAAYCDLLYVLRDGAVVTGGPVDDVLTETLIADVFGIHAHRGTHPATGRPHLAFSPLPTEGTR